LNKTLTAREIVQLVANESSINPNLLLPCWDTNRVGSPVSRTTLQRPLPARLPRQRLDGPVQGAGHRRHSSETSDTMAGGPEVHRCSLHERQERSTKPGFDAGSIAVQSVFTRLYDQPFGKTQFTVRCFIGAIPKCLATLGRKASRLEPLFPAGLAQPEIVLPFLSGERWSLTGGPHLPGRPAVRFGALDFARSPARDFALSHGPG